MKIAVFCSANAHIDSDYFRLTEEMGKWMAEQGNDLVFGGCNIGLMNTIGKAVKAHGGRAIGVVPTIVERGGKTFPDLDVEIPCDNLSDRKDLLLSQSDIVVALPGGIGTLEEFFEMLTLKQLGRHARPIAVLNTAGYFDELQAMLETAVRQRFMAPVTLALYRSFAEPEPLLDYLENVRETAAKPEKMKNI